MKFTEEQQAYIDRVVEGKSIRIEARAGTGKTATNVGALDALGSKTKNPAALICLNTKNEEETQQKLTQKGSTSIAKTWHKFCLMALRACGKRFNVKAKYGGKEKIQQIIGRKEEYNPFETSDPLKKYERNVNRDEMIDLLGKLKNTFLSPTLEDVYNTVAKFGLTPEISLDEFCADALMFLRKSDADSDNIDFDDMIRFPILFDLKWIPPFECIIADECQDNSPIQNLYLERWIKHLPTFTTGDKFQCIYGFRGADVNSFESLSRFLPESLLMSINFRCDKNIIRFARKMVPDINFFEEKDEGEVIMVKDMKEHIQDGDVVLSRFNKLIIPAAFSFLKEGKKATIIGSGELAKSILKLVRSFRADDLDELQIKLDKWEEKQLEKTKSEVGRQIIQDKAETISYICNACKTLSDFENIVEKIFNDNEKEGIFFSTAHKSKGLQWPRVFILDYPNFRMNRGLQDWELEQERNLEYVAVTRAEHQLFLINQDTEK